MRFDSVLRSNHDLKKNGYKVVRKLHKMENKKGANLAYSANYLNTYFFVLSCRALTDVIKAEYPNAQTFCRKCDSFISYLDQRAKVKGLLEKSVISSFLHSYTIFFNQMINEKNKFIFNQTISDLWNTHCLMAYIATWGANH